MSLLCGWTKEKLSNAANAFRKLIHLIHESFNMYKNFGKLMGKVLFIAFFSPCLHKN